MYTIQALQYDNIEGTHMIERKLGKPAEIYMQNVSAKDVELFCSEHKVTLNKRKKKQTFWSGKTENLRIYITKGV